MDNKESPPKMSYSQALMANLCKECSKKPCGCAQIKEKEDSSKSMQKKNNNVGIKVQLPVIPLVQNQHMVNCPSGPPSPVNHLSEEFPSVEDAYVEDAYVEDAYEEDAYVEGTYEDENLVDQY